MSKNTQTIIFANLEECKHSDLLRNANGVPVPRDTDSNGKGPFKGGHYWCPDFIEALLEKSDDGKEFNVVEVLYNGDKVPIEFTAYKMSKGKVSSTKYASESSDLETFAKKAGKYIPEFEVSSLPGVYFVDKESSFTHCAVTCPLTYKQDVFAGVIDLSSKQVLTKVKKAKAKKVKTPKSILPRRITLEDLELKRIEVQDLTNEYLRMIEAFSKHGVLTGLAKEKKVPSIPKEVKENKVLTPEEIEEWESTHFDKDGNRRKWYSYEDRVAHRESKKALRKRSSSEKKEEEEEEEDNEEEVQNESESEDEQSDAEEVGN